MKAWKENVPLETRKIGRSEDFSGTANAPFLRNPLAQ